MMGRPEEALTAFKMLLYFAPGDSEVAQLVQELESRMYEDGNARLRKDFVPVRAQRSEEMGGGDRSHSRAQWRRRIELLQGMLQRVERYRHLD